MDHGAGAGGTAGVDSGGPRGADRAQRVERKGPWWPRCSVASGTQGCPSSSVSVTPIKCQRCQGFKRRKNINTFVLSHCQDMRFVLENHKR